MADQAPASSGKISRIKKLVNRVKTTIKKHLSKAKDEPKPAQQEQSTAEQPSQPTTTPTTTIPGHESTARSLPTPAIPVGFEHDQSGAPTRIAFHTTVDKEKVQALFAKYGLEFDGETVVVSILDKPGHRVEKPIRMRVRRECHNCQTTFSRNLICSKCEHRCCKQCKRYPPRKPIDRIRVKDGGNTTAAPPSTDAATVTV